MVNKILKSLSLSYLSDHIGIQDFNLAKKSYEEICEDGHFEHNISDKALAALLFQNSIPNDYFERKKNLLSFCNALPKYIKDKVYSDLEWDDSKLKWDIKTSEYFIEQLGLPKKILKKKDVIKEKSLGFKSFKLPEYTFKNLKDYQSKVYYDAYSYISSVPHSRCIIQMPTGSGKTRTAMEIVCETLNNSDQNILWLANTEELCEQAFEEFIKAWQSLGNREIDALRFWGKFNPSFDKFQDGLIVMGLDKGYSVLKNNSEILMGLRRQENFDPLIIFDEAHQAIAQTYNELTNFLLTPQVKGRLLGLTATPGRSNSDDDLKLKSFFNEKVKLSVAGYSNPVTYLIDSGYLARPKFISIAGINKEELDFSDEELLNLSTGKDFNVEQLTRIANNAQRNLKIILECEKIFKKHKRVMVFASSVDQSDALAAVLTSRGHNAVSVTKNTSEYDREKFIEEFKIKRFSKYCNGIRRLNIS